MARRSKATSADDLDAFLATLDTATLIGVLVELARDHEPVRKRLDRLQLASQPKALAAAFKTSLSGWRRSTRFIGFRESKAFGEQLLLWLGQVERELAPVDPVAALALVEGFIDSDSQFFDRADDSNGDIGAAVGEGCRLWLRIAALCPTPTRRQDGWVGRLFALAQGDQYGARQPLLSSADTLLDQNDLRSLVDRFDDELVAALNESVGQPHLSSAVFSASGSLHLLSDALRDPQIHVDAVLRYSPQPNALQRQSFAQDFLKVGEPEEALAWLDGDWGHYEASRLQLRAEALSMAGLQNESAELRRQIFDRSGGVADFEAWSKVLPADQQSDAAEHARQRASDARNPVTAARLLLAIGDAADAERTLVERFSAIDGADYIRLVPLAAELESRTLLRGATACYRALLLSILDKGNAPAYRHAANYLRILGSIDDEGADLAPLQTHADFARALKVQHGRKHSFWNQVEAESPQGRK